MECTIVPSRFNSARCSRDSQCGQTFRNKPARTETCAHECIRGPRSVWRRSMLGTRYRHGTDKQRFASLRASRFSWRTCDDFLSQCHRERAPASARCESLAGACSDAVDRTTTCLVKSRSCLPCSEFACRSRAPQGWLQGEYEGDAASCGASLASSFPTAGCPM
jgi:hypothetical protein